MDTTKKPFKPDFLITPYQLFEDATIQSLDRDVYAVVYWYEHLKDGVCKASNVAIAKIANAEPRSVQNSLNRLEVAGFIEREYKDAQKRNRLRIITKISYSSVRTTEDRQKTSEPQSTRERTTNDRASEPQSTRISNSKRVIKESNNNTAQDAVSDGALINLALEGFKDVNPSYSKTLYPNTNQRKAMGRLIKQHGLEKIQSVIAFLPKSNTSRYAPTITTPLQLEAKLGDLFAWAQKQKDSGRQRKGILV